MADDNADSDGTDLSRRRLLSLPAKSFVGYGALKSAVDSTSADPDVSTTANEVPPSETTVDEIPLPTTADTIELEMEFRIWASAVSDGAQTELYVGETLVESVSCTPAQAGQGCYDEKDNVSKTLGLTQHAGEEIEIRYETAHRGGVEFYAGPTLIVDGRRAPASEFPWPVLEGPTVMSSGREGEFRVKEGTMHDSVTDIQWTLTNLDTGSTVKEETTPPEATSFTFDEPGEYFVEAEPTPDSTDEIGKLIVTVIGQPQPQPVPTAVTTGEEPELVFEFDVPSKRVLPSEFEFSAVCEYSYRNDPITSKSFTGSVESETDFPSGSHPDGIEGDVPDSPDATESYLARASVTVDSSEDISVPGHSGGVPGLGYTVTDFELRNGVRTLFDPHRTSQRDTYRMFAFENVEPMDVVPVKAEGGNPAREGQALFEKFRDMAERANKYFASGLGTMGGEGRDFFFPTKNVNAPNAEVEIDNGIIELPYSTGQYNDFKPAEDPSLGNNSNPVLNDFPPVNNSEGLFGVPQVWTVLTHSIQLTLQSGHIHRTPSRGGTGDVLVAVEKEFSSEELVDRPFATGQTIDLSRLDVPGDGEPYAGAIYAYQDGQPWLHEIGHKFGLPDLYNISGRDDSDRRTDIAHWGLMGGGDHYRGRSQITAYCRLVDRFSTARPTSNWLKGNTKDPAKNGSPIKIRPLSKMELDEEYSYIETSAIPTASSGDSTNDALKAYFVPEARLGGESDIIPLEESSQSIQRIPLSRSHNDGIPIFFAGISNPQNHDRDGWLQYLNNDSNTGGSPETTPTLTNKGTEHYHPLTSTKFKFTGGSFNDKVHVDVESATTTEFINSISSLSEQQIAILVSIAPYSDWILEHLPEGAFSTPMSEPLPSLDVLVRTPDGRRAGVDPETGEFVSEIEGSYVTGQGKQRSVLLPPQDDMEIVLSAERFRSALLDRDVGFEQNDPIQVEQRTFVDASPSIEETEQGHPVLHGRTIREDTASIDSVSGEQLAAVTIGVDIEPPRINTASRNAPFVTAHLEIGHGLDPHDLALSTVECNGVSAITDEQYGFVRNLPVTGGQPPTVMVKFDRSALIDELGRGTHEVAISGKVGTTTVLGTTQVEIFGPPGNSGLPGGGGPPGDSPGGGPPHGTPGNGPGGGPPGRGRSK